MLKLLWVFNGSYFIPVHDFKVSYNKRSGGKTQRTNLAPKFGDKEDEKNMCLVTATYYTADIMPYIYIKLFQTDNLNSPFQNTNICHNH